MAMAVLERQGELALIAAIGWSPRQVASLVIGEGAGVSLMGAAIGVIAGIAVSHADRQPALRVAPSSARR